MLSILKILLEIQQFQRSKPPGVSTEVRFPDDDDVVSGNYMDVCNEKARPTWQASYISTSLSWQRWLTQTMK